MGEGGPIIQSPPVRPATSCGLFDEWEDVSQESRSLSPTRRRCLLTLTVSNPVLTREAKTMELVRKWATISDGAIEASPPSDIQKKLTSMSISTTTTGPEERRRSHRLLEYGSQTTTQEAYHLTSTSVSPDRHLRITHVLMIDATRLTTGRRMQPRTIAVLRPSNVQRTRVSTADIRQWNDHT